MVSALQRRQIEECYRLGFTINRTADHTGVHFTTVRKQYQILERAGVPCNPVQIRRTRKVGRPQPYTGPAMIGQRIDTPFIPPVDWDAQATSVQTVGTGPTSPPASWDAPPENGDF